MIFTLREFKCKYGENLAGNTINIVLIANDALKAKSSYKCCSYPVINSSVAIRLSQSGLPVYMIMLQSYFFNFGYLSYIQRELTRELTLIFPSTTTQQMRGAVKINHPLMMCQRSGIQRNSH